MLTMLLLLLRFLLELETKELHLQEIFQGHQVNHNFRPKD